VLRDLTDAERAAYFRGIHPIWGGGLEEPRFLVFQRRLADSPEAQGRYRLLGWFSPEGAPLSALKAYDLHGSFAGRSLRLLGIGAVFTPPELRRRGHAAAMLRAAMDEYRALGAHGAVLFSDIDIDYYRRLGFRRVESLECTVEAAQLPRGGGFRSAMAGDEEEMSRLFEEARAGEKRFALSRDGWSMRFQLRRLRELARARGAGEPEWGLMTEGGAAMVRFGRDTVDVLEAAWTGDGARTRLLAALRDCMQRTARGRLRIWPAGQLRGLFPAVERISAQAMIAPLDGGAMVPEQGGPVELSLLDHI
jgi:GNAT superfamily N-acetyltransferase